MYFKELLEFDFRQVSMKKRMYILKHYILYSYLTGNGLDLSKVYNFMNKVLLVLFYLPGIIKTKLMLKNNKEIADIYYSNKDNLGINISNVDNVFTTNTNLGIEVVDKNKDYNRNDSNVDIYEQKENYQNIYNEEKRKEVSRSQKLKDKLDELINRSKRKKD